MDKKFDKSKLVEFLVRMTGFEPTRLSTLEPETSASAVPPHPLIQLKIESGKLKVI